MAKRKKLVTYDFIIDRIRKYNTNSKRFAITFLILLTIAILAGLIASCFFGNIYISLQCAFFAIVWGFIDAVIIAQYLYGADDNSDNNIPECYFYMAFEDVLCDIRLHSPNISPTNPRRHQYNAPAYFAFEGLQEYHDYGYIPARIRDDMNINPGTKFILIRNPDNNKIIYQLPSQNYELALNDENLHVTTPADITFWEGYSLGKQLDDSNSWKRGTLMGIIKDKEYERQKQHMRKD